MTAATHGLDEEVGRIEEGLQPELAKELKASLQSDAQLLVPPTPILKEDNWPLLTVSKGFFESLAAGGTNLSTCQVSLAQSTCARVLASPGLAASKALLSGMRELGVRTSWKGSLHPLHRPAICRK